MEYTAVWQFMGEKRNALDPKNSGEASLAPFVKTYVSTTAILRRLFPGKSDD